MSILITGATGFVGGHLIEHLLAHDPDAIICGAQRSPTFPAELAHLAGRVRLIACDLTHAAAVDELLHSTKPKQIYHLAGYAKNGDSFREPSVCWQNNVFVSQNLFEAAAKVVPYARIVFVSTGLVYGEPETADEVFDEKSLLKPRSPYAASKAAADVMAYQYVHSHQLAVVRARPFNHFGPRQSADYAVPNFARQVAAIMAGAMSPVLETGPLNVERDLSDVRDVVRAYRLLMDHGRPGDVYNIGQGQGVSMSEIVRRLIERSGVSISVKSKASVRAGDPNIVRCSALKIQTEIGWQPEYSTAQSLDDILSYWAQRTRSQTQ